MSTTTAPTTDTEAAPAEVAFAKREALRLRIATPVDREVSLRVQVGRCREVADLPVVCD